MAVLNTGLAKTSAGGYTIDYSCRFDGTTAYFSRTPASAGNLKTYTCSVWVKRGNVTGYEYMFGAYDASASQIAVMSFDIGEYLQWHLGGASNYRWYTTPMYRDPSAWYHIVFSCDTSTAGGRAVADMQRIYVNGEVVTVSHDRANPIADYEGLFNADTLHTIGRNAGASDAFVTGTMAEVHFIDGTALTPSSFGETGDYGEWKPVKYTGTYGDNGFYLDFADSAALGNDVSGNNNDWTANNIDAADQMLDTPTNNFATFNPLTPPQTDAIDLSEGNLSHNMTRYSYTSTMPLSNGSWYIELYAPADTNFLAGVTTELDVRTGYSDNSVFRIDSGGTINSYNSTTDSDTYTGAVAGDIYGFAVNGTAGTCDVYQNDTKVVEISGMTTTDDIFFFSDRSSTVAGRNVANFGQDSSFAGGKTSGSAAASDGNGIGDFFYEPPSGYLAMCTSNLADVDVTPSEHFNTVTYTGNASTQSITGVGFQPDFTWIKKRSLSERHCLTDAVRGVNSQLQSAEGDAETTATDRITSFDSDGFSLGADAGTKVNAADGDTFVAWNWKANGSGSANTDGDMAETVTVSANADAGFSIVKYTGDGAAATIGHGLSKAPEMIIIKNIDQSADIWRVYHHKNTAAPETDWLILNDTNATQDHIDEWNDTAPTSSVFTVGTANETNRDDDDFIAYCFHSVDGYSKMGSYEGNSSASDNAFVYTGFRPTWVMIKNIDATRDWVIYDSTISTYNQMDDWLFPNVNDAEYTASTNDSDFLSNGFKIRTDNASAGVNTYIYIAFAETPFKYSNAR